jgi:hypothetical protein
MMPPPSDLPIQRENTLEDNPSEYICELKDIADGPNPKTPSNG